MKRGTAAAGRRRLVLLGSVGLFAVSAAPAYADGVALPVSEVQGSQEVQATVQTTAETAVSGAVEQVAPATTEVTEVTEAVETAPTVTAPLKEQEVVEPVQPVQEVDEVVGTVETTVGSTAQAPLGDRAVIDEAVETTSTVTAPLKELKEVVEPVQPVQLVQPVQEVDEVVGTAETTVGGAVRSAPPIAGLEEPAGVTRSLGLAGQEAASPASSLPEASQETLPGMAGTDRKPSVVAPLRAERTESRPSQIVSVVTQSEQGGGLLAQQYLSLAAAPASVAFVAASTTETAPPASSSPPGGFLPGAPPPAPPASAGSGSSGSGPLDELALLMAAFALLGPFLSRRALVRFDRAVPAFSSLSLERPG